MSNRPISADDLDDALFRARLAPLATSVLPSKAVLLDVAGLRSEIRLKSRWPALTLAGIAVVASLSGGAWLYLHPPASVAFLVAQATNTAVPEPPPAPPAPPLSDTLRTMLLQRGDAALAIGDITAARLLYQRAADAGSAEAALALGETYDIQFLLETGARGTAASSELAARWYHRAADLGDQRAGKLLARVAGGKPP